MYMTEKACLEYFTETAVAKCLVQSIGNLIIFRASCGLNNTIVLAVCRRMIGLDSAAMKKMGYQGKF